MVGAFRKIWPARAAWLLGVAVLAASAAASAADAPTAADAALDKAAVSGEVPVAAPPAATSTSRPVARNTSAAAEKGLPEDDYYAKRAKSLLVEDAADSAKQLSLQAAYPGHNVVVCEAGCYGRSKRLVQFAPIVVTNVVPVRTMQPTAAKFGDSVDDAQLVKAAPEAAAGSAKSDEITCVAGCYDAPRSYKTVSRSAVDAATRAEVDAQARSNAVASAGADRPASTAQPRGATGAAASRWMTSSAKANAGADESVSPRSVATPAKLKRRTAQARARRRGASPSGEWFQQINADHRSRAH